MNVSGDIKHLWFISNLRAKFFNNLPLIMMITVGLDGEFVIDERYSRLFFVNKGVSSTPPPPIESMLNFCICWDDCILSFSVNVGKYDDVVVVLSFRSQSFISITPWEKTVMRPVTSGLIGEKPVIRWPTGFIGKF